MNVARGMAVVVLALDMLSYPKNVLVYGRVTIGWGRDDEGVRWLTKNW